MQKFFTFLLCASAVLFAQEQTRYGVKYHGLAGGGFSMCLDASAIFTNPGILGQSRAFSFSIGYGLPYSGIPNAPRELYLAYSTPIRYWWGAGIGVGSFSLPNLSQTIRVNGLLTWSTDLPGTLSVGISPSYMQISYSQPQYMEGRDSDYDPTLNKTPKAFTASIGVAWKQSNYLTIALSGLDITEPNLATDPNDPSGKIPAILAFGASSSPITYFQPEASLLFRSFTVGEQKKIEPHIGLCGHLPNKMVSWRLGWNPQQVSAGIGWHIGAVLGGIDIDYSFVYWLPKSWSGTTSHHFGLTIWGLPQCPCDATLSIEKFYAPETVSVGEKVKLAAVIKNKARKPAENFTTISAFRAFGSTNGWKIIYPSKFTEKLGPKDTTNLSWNWTPSDVGKYEVMVSCNDDGSSLPEVNMSLCERKTKDNRASKPIYVVQQDTAEVVPQYTTVRATQLEIKVEELPMVPVVFFAPKSATLDTFAQKLLLVIAQRVAENPDVEIVIRGFRDTTDGNDTSISQSRAEAVRNFLITQKPDITNRVKIAIDHNPLTPRAKSSLGTEQQKISEENRRAEISLRTNIPDENQFTNKMKTILENNPELILVIKGVRTAGENNFAGLSRAAKMGETLEGNFPFLKGRVVAEDTLGNETKLIFSVDPDGILYRPVERQPTTYWTDLSPPTNTISIRGKGLKDATEWALNVKFNDGKSYKVAEGNGHPPEKVDWNWKIGEEIIPPEKEFTLELVVSTPRGQKKYTSNATVKLVPTGKSEFRETMILVEFFFDEISPLSHFLERRLYNFSKEFVARANRGNLQRVTVTGHTDSIGTFQRNMELSRKRAEKEFEILTNYIAFFAGVDNKDLKSWLASHNAEVSFVGKGSSEPYIVKGIRIGDNSSPYGRTINRRVTLEYNYFMGAEK